MKAVMVMFDTLNRRMLEPYGCDWVQTPNFRRLAERAVTFDNCYIGSAPCMPARRELHTGRYNFLHRAWGPMEPFDDSMPELLKKAGVYSHLASDHYHYWEDGGCTYHTRYNTWQISRGQEGDPWIGQVADPDAPKSAGKLTTGLRRQDWINRQFMRDEKDQPQPKTFARGLEFIRHNRDEDNWFLQIETFDPHEPYFTNQNYKDLYPHSYDGPPFDWPIYGDVTEPEDMVQHCRLECAALHTMCDAYLGKVLDLMDELDMWEDTILIVCTDHGFLLGEHDFWAKCWMPFYDEIAHIPLFIWDPRCGCAGERRQALVQTIDLPATLLEFFGVELPADMQGIPLRRAVADDAPVREACLFGIHGGHVNVTDGRCVYMRAPASEENQPLFNYTHMPTHMRGFFSLEEMRTVRLAEPFSFTRGCRTMKIAANRPQKAHRFGTMLFDLEGDPAQESPIQDPEAEQKMIAHMVRLMKANDAPPEQFERLGL